VRCRSRCFTRVRAFRLDAQRTRGLGCVCKLDLASSGLFSVWTASGCIDDTSNIAFFAVLARRRTARSRADDKVFRQSLVGQAGMNVGTSYDSCEVYIMKGLLCLPFNGDDTKERWSLQGFSLGAEGGGCVRYAGGFLFGTDISPLRSSRHAGTHSSRDDRGGDCRLRWACVGDGTGWYGYRLRGQRGN